MKRSRGVVVAGLVCALSGCGGGGSTGAGIPTQEFTSWAAVQPSSRVSAGGMSQSVTADYTVQPSGDLIVTSIGIPSAVDTTGSTMTFSFGLSRNLTAIQLSTPAASTSWTNALGGATVGCASGACLASNAAGDSAFVGIDPFFVGWNYQTFGAWATGGSTSGTVGSISIGAATPVGAIPTLGNATYLGGSFGFYVNGAGQVFGIGGAVTADVNFAARSIAFATSGTLTSTAGGSTPNAGLDMSGTLTYAAGSNQFTGPVTTRNTMLAGTATGRFYGPAAEEIGGVYALRNGVSLESILGGFGAKR